VACRAASRVPPLVILRRVLFSEARCANEEATKNLLRSNRLILTSGFGGSAGSVHPGGSGEASPRRGTPDLSIERAEALRKNPADTLGRRGSKRVVGRTSTGDPRRQVTFRSGCEPETWISESYSRILTSCIYAGLRQSEADDIAQDIWLWLLRQGTPVLVVSMPWLSGVARNFILRYRRRSFRQKTREGRPLDTAPEPQTAETLPELEASELLDRVAAAVPEIEGRLLALIRRGHSLAEAARLLGIPRGSRAYYHQRLITCGRRELRGRTASAG